MVIHLLIKNTNTPVIGTQNAMQLSVSYNSETVFVFKLFLYSLWCLSNQPQRQKSWIQILPLPLTALSH